MQGDDRQLGNIRIRRVAAKLQAHRNRGQERVWRRGVGTELYGWENIWRCLVLHFAQSRVNAEQVAQGCDQLISEHFKGLYPDPLLNL